MLILDESDEMLNKGFKEQIYEIYRFLPPACQVVIVSATLPHDVLEITTKFMNDPVRVLVKRDELTLEGIKQFFVGVEKGEYSDEDLTRSLTSVQRTSSSTLCVICTTGRYIHLLNSPQCLLRLQSNHHPSCHLLQHAKKGRLAIGEDDREQLWCQPDARRHGAEGARCGHGRVPKWSDVSPGSVGWCVC